MKAKFNFNSQICTTREQAERLLALGLKKETADCYYWQETEPMYGEAVGIWHLETLDSKDSQEHFEYLDKNFGVCLADDEEHYFIPSWSLHRLWELLGKIKKYEGEDELLYPHIYLEEEDVIFISPKSIWARRNFCSPKGVYENIINCLEELIKEGYFNKEYWEE